MKHDDTTQFLGIKGDPRSSAKDRKDKSTLQM
jgi:hypothetical protein